MCSKKSGSSSSSTPVPEVYKKVYGATSITVEGDYVVFTSKDLPDHKSVYYQNTQWADSLYADYDGTNPPTLQKTPILLRSKVLLSKFRSILQKRQTNRQLALALSVFR